MSKRSRATVLDEYLVVQSQRGDTAAFHSLVERWQDRLRGHAYQYTRDAEAAKDVAQEGWLAILRGLKRLDDPGRFRPWAYRIVANKARDWVRREQSRRRVEHVPVQSGEVAQPSDALSRVRAGIEELGAEQRLILRWFYMEDMSVRDIAEALSIPVGTVKSRLYHARNALKQRIEEDI